MKAKIYVMGVICTALISLFVAGTKSGGVGAAAESNLARESVSGRLELIGQVTTVDADKLRVYVEGQGEVLVYLDAATVVRIADHHQTGAQSEADCVVDERSGKRHDLAVGRWIRITAILRGSAYQALTITVLSGDIDLNGQVLVTGTVESVDLSEKTFKIVTYTKEVLTIRLDPVVHHTGTAADLTTIQIGAVVTINGKWRGDGSLAAVNVFPIAVSLETEAVATHADAEVQADAQVTVNADPKDADCGCNRNEDEILEVEAAAQAGHTTVLAELDADADLQTGRYGALETLASQFEALIIQLGD